MIVLLVVLVNFDDHSVLRIFPFEKVDNLCGTIVIDYQPLPTGFKCSQATFSDIGTALLGHGY